MSHHFPHIFSYFIFKYSCIYLRCDTSHLLPLQGYVCAPTFWSELILWPPGKHLLPHPSLWFIAGKFCTYVYPVAGTKLWLLLNPEGPAPSCCRIRNQAILSNGQFYHHFIWHFLVTFSSIYSQTILTTYPIHHTYHTHYRVMNLSPNAHISAYTSQAHPELNTSQVEPSQE